MVLFRCWMTFFGNIIYWFCHLSKLKTARREKEILESYAEFLFGVIKTLQKHEYVSDPRGGILDWSPWPITMIARGFRDDCDGAARLSCWMCKFCKEVAFANEYIIISGWHINTAHVITIGKLDCITDRWFCFSNNQYFEANSFDEVLNSFHYKNLIYYKLR